MATCDVCGRDENMPYNCRHCGGTYCAEHRLPENHDCAGLGNWNDPDGVFDSGFDDSIDAETGGGRGRRRSAEGVLDRIGIDTGPGGPLAYFRNNLSYLFLAIAVLVFGLQYVLAPLLGIRLPPPGVDPGTTTWGQIFTLSTAHPEYVWTWVISVVAE